MAIEKMMAGMKKMNEEMIAIERLNVEQEGNEMRWDVEVIA
jgi:hypothetical protein